MAQFASDSSFPRAVSPIATSPSGDPLAESLIREAHLGDVTQLTELLASSFYGRTGWMGWIYPIIKLGIQEDLKQRIKTEKLHYACLAAQLGNPAEDATPAGYVAGTVEVSQRQSWPWQGLSPKYAYVSNLAVAQPCRRRGIAGTLLTACEALALTWEIHDLYLHVMEDNVTARRLYSKAGFHLFQAEETTVTWLGLQPRRLLMHKRLTPPVAISTQT
jgi:ribosomal protein S18 acetylase RimI-like enzyme